MIVLLLLIATMTAVNAADLGPQCLPTATPRPTATPHCTDAPDATDVPTSIPPTSPPATDVPPTDQPPPTSSPPTEPLPTDEPVPTDLPPDSTDTFQPPKPPESTDTFQPKPPPCCSAPTPGTDKPNAPTESQKIVVYGQGIYELYTHEGVDFYNNVLINEDGQEVNQYRDIEVYGGPVEYHVPLGESLFFSWDEQDGHVYLFTLNVRDYGPPISLWLSPVEPCTDTHDGGYYEVRD
jgi:hypothetical protein